VVSQVSLDNLEGLEDQEAAAMVAKAGLEESMEQEERVEMEALALLELQRDTLVLIRTEDHLSPSLVLLLLCLWWHHSGSNLDTHCNVLFYCIMFSSSVALARLRSVCTVCVHQVLDICYDIERVVIRASCLAYSQLLKA
jgi:hypothetical protein